VELGEIKQLAGTFIGSCFIDDIAIGEARRGVAVICGNDRDGVLERHLHPRYDLGKKFFNRHGFLLVELLTMSF